MGEGPSGTVSGKFGANRLTQTDWDCVIFMLTLTGIATWDERHGQWAPVIIRQELYKQLLGFTFQEIVSHYTLQIM